MNNRTRKLESEIRSGAYTLGAVHGTNMVYPGSLAPERAAIFRLIPAASILLTADKALRGRIFETTDRILPGG